MIPVTIKGQLSSSRTTPSPSIDCYIPEHPTGPTTALVTFAGGGYGKLASHEAYARYFAGFGIASFVVKYRLGTQGHRHPAMLEDGLAALETVYTRASEFNVDPSKIGVIGSSAGGHLAALVLTSWHTHQNSHLVRPAFGILCYPVITMEDPYAHEGSRANLLGDTPSPELVQETSCDKLVSPTTPPCFVWHTVEDPSVPVENSYLFTSALRKHGIPFDFHVYAKGGHGLGLNTPFSWGNEAVRWMRAMGFLDATTDNE